MWDHVINIHPSELLSTKTKESKNKNSDNLRFIPNNILTNFFKELTKYKNDYQ